MEEEEARAAVREALKKREPHIIENFDTLTVKMVRAMLEEDIGIKLDSKPLKAEVLEGLDEIQARMGVAEGECEEIKDSDDQANSSQGASPAGKKRKQTAGKATVRKQAKKQCKTSANSKPSSGAMDKLKKLIHDAGLRLSPQFYIQHKDIESRCKGMEDFLANHGLNIDSKPSEVKAVKKKLELKRDLEGMDTSNIMDGNGRRSMRTTARRSYKIASDDDNSDDEDENAMDNCVHTGEDSQDVNEPQKQSTSISNEDEAESGGCDKDDNGDEKDMSKQSDEGALKDNSSSAQESVNSEEGISDGSEKCSEEGDKSDSDYCEDSSASD